MSDITRLVLTRKVHQSINIGGLITVIVEEVHGKTARIAIEAPRGIAVHRQEIYERILGIDPDDGAAGDCVPAGPVTGPYRPASRSRAPGRAASRRARPAAVMAVAEEERSAVGLPPGVGEDDPV